MWTCKPGNKTAAPPIAVCLLATAMIAGFAALAAGEDNPREQADLARLREAGVAPTLEGVRQILNPSPLSDDDLLRIRNLVRQLGSRRFEQRQQAVGELSKYGPRAADLIAGGLTSPDREVRVRTEAVLDAYQRAEGQTSEIAAAALRVIAGRRLRSATMLLLDSVGARERQLGPLFEQAMEAVAQQGDLEGLEAALAHGPARRRALAVIGVGAVLQEKGAERLQPLLADNEQLVRLAAIRATINYRPRSCIPVLLDLLESADLQVRIEASRILRLVSGERFGYAAADPPERRNPAVARWRSWSREEDALARLRTPLPAEEPKLGRLLLCHFNPFSIRETNADGSTELFTTGKVQSACGCYADATGRRVFADWGGRSVIELDSEGEIAWKYSLPDTPNCLHRAPNGNVLAGLFNQDEIWEIDPRNNQVVWKAPIKGGPTECRRLENGNTFVSLYRENRVVELNSKGEVVWSIENVPRPEGARLTESGAVLVASSTGKALKYSRDGKLIWTAENLNQCYDIVELDNGNIMVGYGGGLRELSPQGETVRNVQTRTVRRIHYY